MVLWSKLALAMPSRHLVPCQEQRDCAYQIANNKVYMRVMIWYNIHLIEDFGRNQAISNPFGEAVLVSSDPNSVRVCNHDDSVR